MSVGKYILLLATLFGSFQIGFGQTEEPSPHSTDPLYVGYYTPILNLLDAEQKSNFQKLEVTRVRGDQKMDIGVFELDENGFEKRKDYFKPAKDNSGIQWSRFRVIKTYAPKDPEYLPLGRNPMRRKSVTKNYFGDTLQMSCFTTKTEIFNKPYRRLYSRFKDDLNDYKLNNFFSELISDHPELLPVLKPLDKMILVLVEDPEFDKNGTFLREIKTSIRNSYLDSLTQNAFDSIVKVCKTCYPKKIYKEKIYPNQKISGHYIISERKNSKQLFFDANNDLVKVFDEYTQSQDRIETHNWKYNKNDSLVYYVKSNQYTGVSPSVERKHLLYIYDAQNRLVYSRNDFGHEAPRKFYPSGCVENRYEKDKLKWTKTGWFNSELDTIAAYPMQNHSFSWVKYFYANNGDLALKTIDKMRYAESWKVESSDSLWYKNGLEIKIKRGGEWNPETILKEYWPNGELKLKTNISGENKTEYGFNEKGDKAFEKNYERDDLKKHYAFKKDENGQDRRVDLIKVLNIPKPKWPKKIYNEAGQIVREAYGNDSIRYTYHQNGALKSKTKGILRFDYNENGILVLAAAFQYYDHAVLLKKVQIDPETNLPLKREVWSENGTPILEIKYFWNEAKTKFVEERKYLEKGTVERYEFEFSFFEN